MTNILTTQEVLQRVFLNPSSSVKVIQTTQDYINTVYDSTQDALRVSIATASDWYTRLVALEENYERTTVFDTISGAVLSSSIGDAATLTGAPSAEWIPDEWPDGVDAVASQMGADSRPNFEPVFTSGGSQIVVSSFATSTGDYTLSGTASGDIALVSRIRLMARDKVNLDWNTVVADFDLETSNNAAGIDFAPAGNISSTDVQAAIQELDTEKEPADATILKQADVDDTPVDGVTNAPISSNWAYDHANASNPHGITSDAILPSQTGNNGKFLTTNGSVSSWGAEVGNVVGPATNIDAYIPQWDGADTKTLKNGLSFKDEDNMASDSNTSVPSQQSVKAYADTKAASSHTHGNITNDGKVGSTASIPLITGADGVVSAGSFGTTVGTFCVGNDARLSDARTPSSHDNTYHSETYITSAGVTYEALNTNSDVGTGTTQVSRGDHTHTGVYEPASISLLKVEDVAGTASQITVTDDGDGSITLSTPQNIATTSSPMFAGLTVSGLTALQPVLTGASDNLISNIFPGFYQRDIVWSAKTVSVAADRYTLVSPGKMVLDVNDKLFSLSSETEFDLSASASWDTTSGTDYTVAANRAGKDFYVYACDNSDTLALLVSANSTYPSGYTADTSRKIGGFHCLCVDVGTISGHTLTGYVAGDILPASVWDLKHRPVSGPEGMVYVEGIGKWVDIYLASVSGGELVSANGGTIADGTSAVAFHWYKCSQWFGRVGKRLLTQHEFVAASIGANQGTNITGSADPGTTGGHVDTASRRMVSDVGCEDCCGVLWQWGAEAGGGASAASWVAAFDANDSGVAGQHYLAPYRALVGGSWADMTYCGSRGSLWSAGPLILLSNSGARGVAEPRVAE